MNLLIQRPVYHEGGVEGYEYRVYVLAEGERLTLSPDERIIHATPDRDRRMFEW